MTVAPTRLFPLLVALVLAVLSYALERAVREGPSGPEPRRHDPDYIVDKLVLTGYGADGAVDAGLTTGTGRTGHTALALGPGRAGRPLPIAQTGS